MMNCGTGISPQCILFSFLAVISSSRSDSVTKFVRSFVRPFVRSFVRSSPFCDSQVFLQLEAYYIKQAADY